MRFPIGCLFRGNDGALGMAWRRSALRPVGGADGADWIPVYAGMTAGYAKDSIGRARIGAARLRILRLEPLRLSPLAAAVDDCAAHDIA